MKEWLQYIPFFAATASAVSAIFAAISALINRQTAILNNRPYFNFEGIVLRSIKDNSTLELDLQFKNVGKTLLYYDVDYIDSRIAGAHDLTQNAFLSYGGYIYPTATSTFTKVLTLDAPQEDEVKRTVTHTIKYGIDRGKYKYYLIKKFELQINRLPDGEFRYLYIFHEEFEFSNNKDYNKKISEMGIQ